MRNEKKKTKNIDVNLIITFLKSSENPFGDIYFFLKLCLLVCFPFYAVYNDNIFI